MLRHDLKRMASALATAALLWSTAGTASAVGADAGTVISNTATVDYSVNTVVQPTVASVAVDFVVDRLIDLTVTAVPVAYVAVTPASDGAFLFTLTNTSNAALGFNLSAANNATDPFGGTDNFDPSALVAVVDAGVLGTYEPLTDVATTVDTLPEDGSIGVWVVATIPGGQGNGDISAVTLTATARETTANGGGAVSEQANPEDPAVMETVFGDGAGDTDAANAADFSDSGAYQVESADVTITKTETLISDPVNGAAPNARHIPGAIVEYVVTVTNDAASALSATTLTISDVLPGDVTFEADTYGAGFGIDLDTVAQSNAVDLDQGSEVGGTVTVTVPSLAPGASAVITFRVSVD